MRNTPPVAPQILGKLLLLQSTLTTACNEVQLGEQVCYTMASVPGVNGTALYMNEKLVAQKLSASKTITQIPLLWSEVVELRSHEHPDYNGLKIIPLQTRKATYGFILLEMAENEESSQYLPFLENTVNNIALLLENRKQEADLVKLNLALEKQVENKSKALTENEKKYLALYENAPDMYVSVDAKTALVIECNKTLSDKLGYSKDEIIGHPIFNLYHPDCMAKVQKAFQTFVSTGTIDNAELELKKKDGEKIHVILNVRSVRDEQGEILYSRSAWRDITNYKQIEMENKNLEAMLHQSQKLESLGTLAGGIAHDFNNILSAVIGFTELALSSADEGSELENDLQEVKRAGMRAKDLIKQILTFARQTNEKVEPIQINILVKEALKFIKSSIPSTIQINESIASDSLVMAAPTHVHQILMNLFTNASQAMETKGGLLNVSLKDVTIDETSSIQNLKHGEYIKLTVEDTGHGISPQNIGTIFDPYFTTKGLSEGTGMGLAVVHGIVERYDGKINVTSTLNKGTCFTVHLPASKSYRQASALNVGDLKSGTENILYVDDEASIVKIGTRSLERLGYSVTSKTSSMEALKLFSTKPHEFDLVITDMTMPDMTGDKLAAELLQIRPDLPIILCTGYSKTISEEIAAKIGIRAFLYKPIAKAELAATVRNVLDNTKL